MAILSLLFIINIPSLADGGGSFLSSLDVNLLRVSILNDNEPGFALSSEGSLAIIDMNTGDLISRGEPGIPWWFSSRSGLIKVGQKGLFRGPIRIKTAFKNFIRIYYVDYASDTLVFRRYRGEMEVLPSEDGRIKLVNIIPLEEYLYGVLPGEISPSWPIESLKAQAVAARTFALYQKTKNSNGNYDLDSTLFSQMYEGVEGEDRRVNSAVDQTKGIVVTYRGRLVPTYYHANSGGHTEDVRDVWGGDGVPYLKGVVDPFSKDGPKYRWETEISLKEIESSLRENGFEIGKIFRIEVAETTPSSRVKTLRIVHSGGTTLLQGNRFRLAIDPLYTIRSTMFTIGTNGDSVLFTGRGWGHGVGLSQESAKVMAELGFSYERILEFFYPGVEIGYPKGG